MLRRLVTAAALTSLLVGLLPRSACAQPAAEAVKGAFVFNVLNFVEWPAAAFPSPAAPLRIAVVAPKASPGFAEAFLGKVIRGHPIVVDTVGKPEESVTHHVVIVTADAHSELRQVVATFRGTPVLTISEQKLDGSVDAIMALGVVGAKLAFAVNLDEADAAGLQINPNLLKLARSVKGARAKTK